MPAANGKRASPRRWLLAAVRRSQLFRIVRHRRSTGARLDATPIMVVACDCLADLEGYPVPPSGSPHLGLHPVNVEQTSIDLRLALAPGEIDDLVARVATMRSSGGNLSSDEAGRLLQLSRSEREATEAWLFDAAEEPADARRARKLEEKRLADRERQKAKRAAAREANGLVPFVPGRTIQSAKPWLTLGMTERTWYRKGKPAASEIGRNPSRTFARPDDGKKQSRTFVADGSGREASQTFEEHHSRRVSATGDRISSRKISQTDPSSWQAGGRSAALPLQGEALATTVVVAMVGGGDMAAGYLLAKAIPAAQFQRWMKAAADGSLSRIDLMEIQSAAMKARNVTRAAS